MRALPTPQGDVQRQPARFVPLGLCSKGCGKIYAQGPARLNHEKTCKGGSGIGMAKAAAAAAPAPLTSEEALQEALRQAAAEGLTLQPGDNASGFKGVTFSSSKSRPYQAQVRRGGKALQLGSFATAEEAALCYARDAASAASAAKAQRAPPSPPPPAKRAKAAAREMSEEEGIVVPADESGSAPSLASLAALSVTMFG